MSITQWPPTSNGTLVWASSGALRCVLWNGSATFNIYQRTNTSSPWTNSDCWTRYEVRDAFHAHDIAVEHMEQESPAHPGPFAHGRSGLLYCTACLASAPDLDALQTAPCYATNFED
jgi:hypothetical protein